MNLTPVRLYIGGAYRTIPARVDGRIAVVSLRCRSMNGEDCDRWFPFDTHHGAKLADGCGTMKRAVEIGRETIASMVGAGVIPPVDKPARGCKVGV
jgi:hypothetical protein